MNPVQLPSDVCFALDDAINENFTNYQILNLIAKQEWTSRDYKCLNSQDVNTIMRALVLGYEVELTPEERLKELCSSVYNDPTSYFDKGFRFGVQRALELHGIYYDWLKG